MQTSKWYSITAKADDSAEVRIYNEIGEWGINAEAFSNDLGKIKVGTIHLHINSPGGQCFDALAIFNSLRNHPARIVAHIDGLAASAASIIMLAGDEVRIAQNGLVMIHEAKGGAYGDAADLKRYAGMLDKLNKTFAKTYAEKTGKTKEDMAAAMAAETWYDAQEALDAGLVDFVDNEDGDLSAAAASAVAKYQKAPETLRRVAALYQPNGPSDAPAPSGAGTEAATILEQPMNLETFKAFAAEHPEAVASYIEQGKRAGISEAASSASARARAIREACAGNDTVAFDTFLSGKDADDAKATLAAIASATAATNAALAVKDAEIARLTAVIGTQGAVGTAAAVAAANAPAPVAIAAKSPAEAQAMEEWDAKASGTEKFQTKEKYVFYRSLVLTGQHVE
jgi:ATP-dependent Clp endopeptidase proteolytic subunit ClpP